MNYLFHKDLHSLTIKAPSWYDARAFAWLHFGTKEGIEEDQTNGEPDVEIRWFGNDTNETKRRRQYRMVTGSKSSEWKDLSVYVPFRSLA